MEEKMGFRQKVGLSLISPMGYLFTRDDPTSKERISFGKYTIMMLTYIWTGKELFIEDKEEGE